MCVCVCVCVCKCVSVCACTNVGILSVEVTTYGETSCAIARPIGLAAAKKGRLNKQKITTRHTRSVQ